MAQGTARSGRETHTVTSRDQTPTVTVLWYTQSAGQVGLLCGISMAGICARDSELRHPGRMKHTNAFRREMPGVWGTKGPKVPALKEKSTRLASLPEKDGLEPGCYRPKPRKGRINGRQAEPSVPFNLGSLTTKVAAPREGYARD